MGAEPGVASEHCWHLVGKGVTQHIKDCELSKYLNIHTESKVIVGDFEVLKGHISSVIEDYFCNK